MVTDKKGVVVCQLVLVVKLKKSVNGLSVSAVTFCPFKNTVYLSLLSGLKLALSSTMYILKVIGRCKSLLLNMLSPDLFGSMLMVMGTEKLGGIKFKSATGKLLATLIKLVRASTIGVAEDKLWSAPK